MTIKRKKLVERERLNSFLRCTNRSDFPEPEEGESPDFLFRFDHQTIGIEVTGMVSPRVPGGDNPRQSSRTLERLTDNIRNYYDRTGGPRAHVSVFPGNHPRLSKADIPRLAQHIAAQLIEGIEKAIGQHRLQQPWRIRGLRPVIQSIAAWHCPSDAKPRWHVHRGGAVDSANADDILATLRNKEDKLQRYRAKATEVWLLIVCDLFAEGLFIDPPAKPVIFAVPSGFDRVFCLEWTGAHAVEIPVIA